MDTHPGIPVRTFRLGYRLQLFVALIAVLAMIWTGALYDIRRDEENHLNEARTRTRVQAQVFAEYSRSTLKRVNEVILNLRTEWNGDWQRFANKVRHTEATIDDVTFQVAIIGPDGLMKFSNLSRPNERADLSEREHFQVHRDAPDQDRLFISRPLMGKVSRKWSIQVTRPIQNKGRFDGVLVVSVSPSEFVSFAVKLGVQGKSSMTVVRDTGEVMARFPEAENSLGRIIKDVPFFGPNAQPLGNYRRAATIDGTERIFGYARLPEYGMSFVLGEAVEEVLAPHITYRNKVLTVALAASALAITLIVLFNRTLGTVAATRKELRTILELSPDAFISFDRDRRVRYCSPAFERLTGITNARAHGLTEDDFRALLLTRCRADRDPDLLSAFAANGPRRNRRVLLEIEQPEKRVLEVGLREAENQAISQVMYMRDITTETEVDRMKSEFLSTAAHELRTPMASIFGYSEIMIANELEAAEMREFIGTIYKQSKIMIDIINELLDLARIEERRGKDFKLQRVDAAELVSDAAAAFKPADARPGPLVADAPAGRPIRIDRAKLLQTITNVLSNAYKYSPEGGAVSLSLVDSADRREVGIRVTDQGIGMTREQLARVGERFYRADGSGRIPGTGLGMSIVKEILSLHHGHFEIDSAAGKGTTVTLWLPISSPAAATAVAATPAAEAAA